MNLENFPTRETAIFMMTMISPIYEHSYVGKWIFEVMSAPLELARQTVKDLEKESFPETATWSLPYWEQAYGIETNEGLSIEDRRRALTKKRNYRRPMNPFRIAQIASETCGRPVEFIENVAPHTFEIRIAPGTAEAEIQAVIDVVREVKQSQKSFRVVFETPVGIRIHPEANRQVFGYRMTGENKKSGRWPQPSTIGKIQNVQVDIAPADASQVFPYVLAGTVPDVNTPGTLTAPGVKAHIAGDSTGIVYKICGATRL